MVVQRPDAERVPATKEFPFFAVPDAESVIANKFGRTPVTPFLVRLDDNFAISNRRVCLRSDSEAFYQIAAVVDTRIGCDNISPGIIRCREPFLE